MKRGRSLAMALAGLLAGCVIPAWGAEAPEWSLAAQRRLLAGPDAAGTLAAQQRLVQQAERNLAAGTTAAAQQAFDLAATMVHSSEVEMGLVRTYMQAGDYRRALTFASHAAGAHRNVPAGTALYAWLLQLGGQGVFAQRLLDDALALAPGDAALAAVRQQTRSIWPQPGPPLLQPPLRVAPYATGTEVPPGTRLVGTAMLIGDGTVALAPAAVLGARRTLWVRNGLGTTVAATATVAASDDRLALLRLDAPLPMPAVLTVATREPFAGSPAYTVEHGAAEDAQARWPVLRQGFFGRMLASPGRRLLGIDAPPGPRGGPVFDRFGALAGVAVPMADGPDELVAWSVLARDAGPHVARQASAAPREVAAVDVIYESALRLSLQVLAHDDGP